MTDVFSATDRSAKEIKSERINLRLKPSILRVIQEAADRDNRPLSQWVEKLLRDHVEKADGRPSPTTTAPLHTTYAQRAEQ